MAVNKLDITMMEDVGTSASQLLQRDGSGNIPAVDGSQVTGVTEFTTTTSDPAIDTNPAGGVGSLWYNKTGGEMYVCTDATAGSNVWTNVGAGSGNIVPWFYAGTQYGYCAGGNPNVDTIDKYSFTANADATDVGNLVGAKSATSGHHSKTYGYACGGANGAASSTNIDKYSFTTDGNATDVGDLTVSRGGSAGVTSENYGYSCTGGIQTAPATYTSIDKFSFASDGNATAITGVTLEVRQFPGGTSSTTYGYMHGGHGPPQYNSIEKFSFSTEGNCTDVGDMARGADTAAGGASSSTHGYIVGGNATYSIGKYSFSTDGNSTNVGDLPADQHKYCAATSSLTYGYRHGGGNPASNIIENFPFASDSNGTDVGNLTVARNYVSNSSY